MIILLLPLPAESRLSELSRPPDLREVDITDAASVTLYTKDLAFKLWKYVIPASVKDKAFSLCDDFIFSFCISKVGMLDLLAICNYTDNINTLPVGPVHGHGVPRICSSIRRGIPIRRHSIDIPEDLRGNGEYGEIQIRHGRSRYSR